MSTPQNTSKHTTVIDLKAFGYLFFIIPALSPFVGYGLFSQYGYADLFAFTGVAFFYLAIPVADYIIGKDSANPQERDVAVLSAHPYFRYIPMAALPMGVASLLCGLFLLTNWTELSVLGQIGLIASLGTSHASLMINTAHELIHKSSKVEQTIGGLLLCLVAYPSFKIEHVRGHHIHVATPEDQSTSVYGQSLYHFLPRAITKNVLTAWQLETQLLEKRGKSAWSRHNELIRWYVIVALIMLIVAFNFGPIGIALFVAQSVIAIGVLETVNYLEHYGLKRQKLANGRYERTSHEHSWNSNYLLSNLLTFQIQKHSDHHANPRRRYNVLRHFDDSPQLPAGYSAMILAALIPPLWMRLMNPRVERYYAKKAV